jgi:hypothetical protein
MPNPEAGIRPGQWKVFTEEIRRKGTVRRIESRRLKR